MESDQTRWDQRYLNRSYPDTPSKLLTARPLPVTVGKALDIACGNGRNSDFLHRNGFQVDAVDISTVGLEQAHLKNPGVNIIHADLDQFIPPANQYDLIININFLQRRLFPYIRNALKDGGILMFETFLWDPNKAGDRELYSDHYLLQNELLHAFLSLRILRYTEAVQQNISGDDVSVATLIAQNVSST